jgi:engulfment/cell motility protein 1
VTKATVNRSPQTNWRFVKLSHNRRYLHYADFDIRRDTEPVLDDLPEKIDLSIVSSVVSNVSASTPPTTSSSDITLKNDTPNGLFPSSNHQRSSNTSTRLTIHGYVPGTSSNKESVLLQLHPQTHTLASEWLDGLLMLLSQQPITSETSKLVQLVSGYGLKIRLLNVRFEDGVERRNGEEVKMPSREGLDEDYWFDIGGLEGGG